MLSLSLAKLSVALDTDPDAHSFTWHHDTHDLTFVIDSYGAHGSSQLIKVIQGTQVRQLIELERLIAESDDMIKAMQHRGVSLKAEQLPISAIVRCPLLAIRWQLPNQKIRRAQIKFRSSHDYEAAYIHLHQLGLRMTSSNDVQSRPRPCTPSSPSQTSSAISEFGKATHLDQPAARVLTCPSSRLTDLTNRPFTASDAPTLPNSRSLEAAHSRPLTALARQDSVNFTTSGSFSSPLTPPILYPRPSSATTSLLENYSPYQSFPPQYTRENASKENSLSSNVRPDVSMSSKSSHTTETPLPPRRDLPFHRLSAPLSSGSDTNPSSSRPCSSIMGPPPLPARVPTLGSILACDVGVGTEPSQIIQPTMMTKSLSQLQAIQLSLTPESDLDTHGSSGTPLCKDESKRPPSGHPYTANCLSDFNPSTPSAFRAPDSHLRLHESPAGDTRGQLGAISLKAPASPVPVPVPVLTSSDHNMPRSFHTTSGSDMESLNAYLAQSVDGRRAALNELIFRHLESDEFLRLVEDMESCWARIAVGMR